MTSYTLTPEAFRRAHPELATSSYMDGNDIVFTNKLTGKAERLRCYVPLCSTCDKPVRRGCECETLTVADPLRRAA